MGVGSFKLMVEARWKTYFTHAHSLCCCRTPLAAGRFIPMPNISLECIKKWFYSEKKSSFKCVSASGCCKMWVLQSCVGQLSLFSSFLEKILMSLLPTELTATDVPGLKISKVQHFLGSSQGSLRIGRLCLWDLEMTTSAPDQCLGVSVMVVVVGGYFLPCYRWGDAPFQGITTAGREHVWATKVVGDQPFFSGSINKVSSKCKGLAVNNISCKLCISLGGYCTCCIYINGKLTALM